jgi:transmembrane protein 33
MSVVAYIELVIFVRVLLGAITFQNSLLSPIIFAHFLRQRYYHSLFTRNALANTSRRIDRYLSRPGIPPSVVMIWRRTKMLIGRWGGRTLEPQNASADGAPRR